MKLGRALNWDVEKEQFVNDDQANAMLSRRERALWGDAPGADLNVRRLFLLFSCAPAWPFQIARRPKPAGPAFS